MTTPIQDNELERIFSPLRAFDPVVLAVSGGADSMALMVLVKWWVDHCGGKLPIVASVDHGLRASSKEDVAFVLEQAESLGFQTVSLKWVGEKPKTGLQEAAREARYQLLFECVKHFEASRGTTNGAVVTAHHQEDQAETLLMRLARGSGLDGLSAMRAHEQPMSASGVCLLRPLLDISKERLVATLRAEGSGWLDDPSNRDERFERVRLRDAQETLENVGLSADVLARSARRLNRARDALERTATAAIQEIVNTHDGAWGEIARRAFDDLPEEIRLRVVAHVVRAYGGRTSPVRLSKLEALCLQLVAEDALQDTMTLGGCVVCRDQDHYAVYREPGRKDLCQVSLQAGESVIWDNRFKVVLPADLACGLTLKALGVPGYAALRKRIDQAPGMLSRAAATLPSFWIEGDLVAVPHLGYSILPPGSDGPKMQFLW